MKWLNRSLVELPHEYCLCLSAKEFRSVMKRMRVPKSRWGNAVGPNANAQVTFFDWQDRSGKSPTGHRNVAIVTILNTEHVELEQVYATLVHEAMHIWREAREILGERNPSSEFEAYALQRISQSLMFEYKERTQTKRKKKFTPKAKS